MTKAGHYYIVHVFVIRCNLVWNFVHTVQVWFDILQMISSKNCTTTSTLYHIIHANFEIEQFHCLDRGFWWVPLFYWSNIRKEKKMKKENRKEKIKEYQFENHYLCVNLVFLACSILISLIKRHNLEPFMHKLHCNHIVRITIDFTLYVIIPHKWLSFFYLDW